MTLGELIAFLERHDPATVVPVGLGRPHSYRGYYEDLAFELTADVTVGQMLAAAKGALGKVFCGYKGGDYEMSEYTTVWVAEYGATGEGLGPLTLAAMMGEPPVLPRPR